MNDSNLVLFLTGVSYLLSVMFLGAAIRLVFQGFAGDTGSKISQVAVFLVIAVVTGGMPTVLSLEPGCFPVSK